MEFARKKFLALQLLILGSLLSPSLVLNAFSKTHYHDLIVAPTSYTRLCETKDILTVNGQFPAPTLYVNRGDTLIANVINQAHYPITLHWHGLLNPRNPWSDGPQYVTMCGLQPGENFTHNLSFTTEEGTIWYHAHSDWTRATVHGAMVVYPKPGTTYPYPQPDKEYVVVLSEWWTEAIDELLEEATITGADFSNSDAYTINGQPGDQYQCSANETTRFVFEQGKRYLLRLVDGVMSCGHFFGIANHTLTVVGRDGSYLKPFQTDYVFIVPGQTVDVLVEANQPKGLYYMEASTYTATGYASAFDTNITTAVVEYEGYNASDSEVAIPFPSLPGYDDTDAAYYYVLNERSLASKDHPIDVPMEIDSRFVFTVSMNQQYCHTNTCTGSDNTRLSASMNNISFANPSMDILEAYYESIKGVYTTDFPSFPPFMFNFTDDSLTLDYVITSSGTKVKVLKYNQTVELVFQGTSTLYGDHHPMHLHGYDFYVVARDFGNFDPINDPLKFNLVDPPRENTVGVPHGGWTAIRFRADNPGVWLLHCHLDRHFTWGMSMVFIVLNGPTEDTSIISPPPYMPNCSDSMLIHKSRLHDPAYH